MKLLVLGAVALILLLIGYIDTKVQEAKVLQHVHEHMMDNLQEDLDDEED